MVHHSNNYDGGFSTAYRSYRDFKSGGIMPFASEDNLSNLHAIENKPKLSLYVELNLRIDKWIIKCSYYNYCEIVVLWN